MTAAGTSALRIANCSGFYGDRLDAAREMVEGGPIDVLTGDYLAELTMAILWRLRRRDPESGYVRTFLTQMEEVLGTCLDRGIKVVSNAGGLNPAGMAARLEEMTERLGLEARIAWVTGDDLTGRVGELQQVNGLRHFDTGRPLPSGTTPLTAHAYLGGRGIAEALSWGADVVVTGRVTDAAVVIGPGMWAFDWSHEDHDQLAGALVAGHIIECGAQCTGGNYAFFERVPGSDRVGFPIAELSPDGSSVITKHPGTGGLVSVGTVTAQLLYEVGGPRYHNPDVTARLDSIRLSQEGPDRVAVTGVRGEPPPPTLKVALNYLGGYRNSVTMVITGLDAERKAESVTTALWESLGGAGQFEEAAVSFNDTGHVDPATNEAAMSHLRITVKDPDPAKVGKRFSRAAVELALAHYPGFFMTAPPRDSSPYAVYWPTSVEATQVVQQVRMGDREKEISTPPPTERATDDDRVGHRDSALSPAAEESGLASWENGDTAVVPLGRIAGARSGDKGGDANVGVWVESEEAFGWLAGFLSESRFRELVPEASGLEVERHVLSNLRAVNFVVRGLLGEGVSSSTRTDPQAKSLGEYLRAKWVPIPVPLLDARSKKGPSVASVQPDVQ
ncbi:MAG: DUF1446 domain-containing protein [bacterium]|nr:DUF1446 domain-containing protein [bacterium]